MFLQPIDGFVYAWIALALLSTAYVAWDQFRGNPEPNVMRWGFVLVTLYMGPVGLLLYVMADKEPAPGTHEEFVKPLWRQGIGSTVHCVAGDATGIILAAVAVALLGLPMWLDLIIEYIAGFLLGLLIFQALFMKSVMGGSYLDNVRRSFVPEFVSMNAMMAGMAPVMSLLMMGRDMRAMWPGEPLFWVVMSLGIIAGFAVAYPVNVWLVAIKLKHGLMTLRPNQAADRASSMTDAPDAPAMTGHAAMGAQAMGTQAMAGMNHAQMAFEGTPRAPQAGGDGDASTPPAARPPLVTNPQLVAVLGFTLVILIAGMTLPGAFVNMRLTAHEVGGLIMPPGMVMTQDTPAEAMQDMAAVSPRSVSYIVPSDQRGDQVLAPRLENGVKVFALEASIVRLNILPDQQVDAYAINRQVPGPRIELEQGDRVRFDVTNNLPESTSLHWHGLIVPNEMDGAAGITQDPINPGERFSYAFTVVQAGTYFYHSHERSDRQQTLGLYGALIIRPTTNPENLARIRQLVPDAIDPATAVARAQTEPSADLEYTVQLQEWLKRDGLTYPAMLMEGALPNYFTINGKAYPSTDTIKMRVGQTLKLRFIGTNNNFVHPMHVHGGPFLVVARDGETLPVNQRFLADTVNVAPGQRYDVVWKARRPGRWLIHCHIPHHTVNNNVEQQGGGGLMMVIEVR